MIYVILLLLSCFNFATCISLGQSIEKDTFFNGNSLVSWEPIISNITAGKNGYYQFTLNSSSNSNSLAPSYETFVFISGNIDNITYTNNTSIEMNKNSILNEVGLRMSHSFDDSISKNISLGDISVFEHGYVENYGVAPLNVASGNNSTDSDDSSLYIMVQMFNTTTGKALDEDDPLTKDVIINYRLSISENDLVYQWDTRPWVEVLDTDYSSALLMTGNITYSATENKGKLKNMTIEDLSLYDLYVYDVYEFNKLNTTSLARSITAIKNGNYLISSQNETESTNNLDEKGLRIQKYIGSSAVGVSEFFYITGLNHSTRYISLLTKKITNSDGNLTDVGGIIFAANNFTTQSDNTCSLIYGLNFCNNIAYSVPTSSFVGDNKTLMAETYEYITTGLYNNFTDALSLVDCDTELDARYSPLRTCADCADAYKNWLCAVSIPRCTSKKSEFYLKRDRKVNRNKLIDLYIKPTSDYYEILPCIDMCHYIVRDCPSKFNFQCPDSNNHQELLLHSYNFWIDMDDNMPTCNMLTGSSSS